MNRLYRSLTELDQVREERQLLSILRRGVLLNSEVPIMINRTDILARLAAIRAARVARLEGRA